MQIVVPIYNYFLLSFPLSKKKFDFFHSAKKQSDGEADISGEELHEILKEIDTNMNGQVELDEYLQVGNINSAPQIELNDLDSKTYLTL